MSDATISVGDAVAAGAAAFAVATGLDPKVMIWALSGSILGIALAKPTNRPIYPIFVFIVATMMSGLAGTVIADVFATGSAYHDRIRDISAALFGVAFHPILTAFLSAIPSLVEAIAERVKRIFGGVA